MIKENHESILTQDHLLKELLQLSETIAKSRATVLIQGDSGSGKRTLAKMIYEKSQRAHFGFSIFDASRMAQGDQEKIMNESIAKMKGGTLLIIEVAHLTMQVQGLVFQAMSENVDVRWMATTSKSLSTLVEQGLFREDLFYRLNVVNLKIPPLTARLGDVEFLSAELVKKYSKQYGKLNLKLSAEAIQVLNAHLWPGNVRELESVMERAVLLATHAEIRARDLQMNALASSEGRGGVAVQPVAWKPGSTLDQIERKVILEALKHHDGNRTHTAKALGISIRTLRNKLAEYRVMGIHA